MDIDGLIKMIRLRNSEYPPGLVTSGEALILAGEVERMQRELELRKKERKLLRFAAGLDIGTSENE